MGARSFLFSKSFLYITYQEEIIRYFGKRLVELFFSEIALSALVTLLFEARIIPVMTSTALIFSGVVLVIVAVFWFFCLREYYFAVAGHKMYYKTNLVVLGIFFVISMVFAAFDLEPLFTWLFLPCKFLRYAGLPKAISPLLMNLILLVCVFIAPKTVTLDENIIMEE